MNKQTVVKQSIGIDISKDSFEVCFKEQTQDGAVKIKGTSKFDNNQKGFELLKAWSTKREKTKEVVYVMEATGVYHEELVYFLHECGKKVYLELAQRIKHYVKSKGIKTKTDKVDSSMIAEYGIERNLSIWTPPSPLFRQLRDLSREHTSVTHQKTISSNRLHACKHAHHKDENVIKRLEEQIEFFDCQLVEIENELNSKVKEDKIMSIKVERISAIKGLGLLSIVKLIAETGGFYLFKNISQLVSYAGLDVVEDSSGKHVGKTRISKKGNSNLRKILYMPALAAIRSNDKLKSFNDRIMESHQHKKQGIVAVMRKLLILTYTLWKKNQEYDPNYNWQSINKVEIKKAERASA